MEDKTVDVDVEKSVLQEAGEESASSLMERSLNLHQLDLSISLMLQYGPVESALYRYIDDLFFVASPLVVSYR